MTTSGHPSPLCSFVRGGTTSPGGLGARGTRCELKTQASIAEIKGARLIAALLRGGRWPSWGLSGKDSSPQRTGSASFQRGRGVGPPWWSCREFGGRKVLRSAVYLWAMLMGPRYLGGLRAMRCAWGSFPTTLPRRLWGAPGSPALDARGAPAGRRPVQSL